MPILELTCVGCGGVHFDPFFVGPDRLQEKPGCYQLWRCQMCNTMALYPQPSTEETAGYYPEDYVPYQPGLASGLLPRLSTLYGTSKQVSRILRKMNRPGRALDIGCGTGNFLSALQQQGWATHGLEINPHIAWFVHAQRGLDIVVGDSLSTAFADGTFDLITFWDVLEHLPDPRQALREARRLARTSALLIIGIPNPESLEAHIFDRYWAGWDVPRHLWLFPRQILIQMLQETGWNVEEIRYARGRHFLLAQSLRFWLQDMLISKRVSQALLTVFQSWIVRCLFLPYFSIVEWLKIGSAMVIYSRPAENGSENKKRPV
jgi:SAM-dependent methyltransferase